MITRKQVAERAGVSVAAVSYVVNGKSGVGEETRRKVLQAIEELGYEPNVMARSLKTKRTQQLAVLVNYLGNSFEAGLLLHMEARAREHGYYLVFQTHAADTEDEFVRFTAGRADGVILLGQLLKPESLERLVKLKLPVVSAMKPAGDGDSPFPYVDIDWEAGMRSLVAHLQSRGHNRIGFVSVPWPHHYLRAREDAFRRAMAAAGLDLPPERVLNGGGRLEQALEAMRRHLASAANDAFSAVVAANDLMAVGLLSAARQAGAPVPQQLAIAGCENILMTAQTTPGVTVLDYPRERLAAHAVDLLVERIGGRTSPAIVPDAELLIRGST